MKSPDPVISNVAAGTMTSFVAFSIAILVSPDYRLVWVKNHAWLLFGLILALGKLAFHDERQRIKLKKVQRYRQVQALMAKRQRAEEEAEERELNMPLKRKSKEKDDASQHDA